MKANHEAKRPPGGTATVVDRFLVGNPLHREGLAVRLFPYVLVMVLALLSPLLLGHLRNPNAFIASIGIMAVLLVFLVIIPWERIPGWMVNAVPVGAIALLVLVSIASGGLETGSGLMFLLPAFAASVLGRPRDIAFVLVLVAFALVGISLFDHVSVIYTVTRPLYWFATAVLMSTTIYRLRTSLIHLVAEREEYLEEETLLAYGTENLASSLEPDEVLRTAAEITFNVISTKKHGVYPVRVFRPMPGGYRLIASADTHEFRTALDPALWRVEAVQEFPNRLPFACTLERFGDGGDVEQFPAMGIVILAEEEELGLITVEMPLGNMLPERKLQLLTKIRDATEVTAMNAVRYERISSQTRELQLLDRVTRSLAPLRHHAQVLAATAGWVEAVLLSSGVQAPHGFVYSADGEVYQRLGKYPTDKGSGKASHKRLLQRGREIVAMFGTLEATREYVPIADVPHLGSLVPGQVDGVWLGWIPVRVEGTTKAVIEASSLTEPLGDAAWEQLQRVGSIVDLALANALAHERLEDLAATDPLTGLANRRAFEQALTSHSRRTPFVVMACDVDRLKHVNDTLGHDAGDRLLLAVAHGVTGVLRKGEVFARLGGDEFAIFMPDATRESARLLAERILRALAGAATHEFTPSLSIGFAEGAPGDDPRDVAILSDEAMYQAKRAGGNQYHLYGDRRVGTHSGGRTA